MAGPSVSSPLSSAAALCFVLLSSGLPLRAFAEPKCSQPIDPGVCKGNFPRFAFDAELNDCTVFTYGGCGGNSNNFLTRDVCLEECVPGVCELPIDKGIGKGFFPSWGFSGKEGKCVEFIFGGGGGNANRFETEEECTAACGPDVCELPIAPGVGNAFFPSWGFSQKEGKCVEFIFGGAGGNGNRFATEAECLKACGPDVCSLPIDKGTGKAIIPSWAFSTDTDACVEFVFGGGAGNGNRFETEEECLAACDPEVDVCGLPIDKGTGKAIIPSWAFSTEEGKCVEFNFGGGAGNGNRFETEADCKAECVHK